MSAAPAIAAVAHPGMESFFSTLAEAAAALIGLLFVALTIDGVRAQTAATETRAGAALLAFLNVLVTSLLALTPGDDPGWTAMFFSGVGGLYVLASVGPLADWAMGAEAAEHRGRVGRGLVLLLAVVFCVEFVLGLRVVADPRSQVRLSSLGTLLVVLLVGGISRTWEIVGVRDPSLTASLRLLTRRLRRSR